MKKCRENYISRLTIPNRMCYVEGAIALAREIAGISGFDGHDSELVALAVEEAATNVIEHGLETENLETFDICFDQSPSALSISIHEKGMPFDPERVPDYRPPREDDDGSGLGLHLMKRAMDEVAFLNHGKDGKETRMIKYLKNGRVDSLFSEDELELLRNDGKNSETRIFSIRPLRSEDALEVSRCAYRAYGYSYLDYIYYPERVIERNQNGLMRSFVALSEDGSLAGHVALLLSDSNSSIAELGAAFVRPDFRGAGLLKRLTAASLEEARRLGLKGVFVHAVTSHVASQRGAVSAGFVSTGILLGALPRDLDFKSLTGKIDQKESCATLFLPLGSRPEVSIYPPERYRSLIERLYGDLGFSAAISTSSSYAGRCGDEGRMRAYGVPGLNIAEIKVLRYGGDSLEQVRSRLRSFCLDRYDAIYLYLDLEDTLTAVLTEEFRKLGFIFCGVLPGEMEGRDALIMQYLNNLRIDVGEISLADERAGVILDRIVEEMPAE